MNDSYRAFFGLTKEPFSAELCIKEILEIPDLKEVKGRFQLSNAIFFFFMAGITEEANRKVATSNNANDMGR